MDSKETTNEDHAASLSWRSLGHNRPLGHQSQWLQATLSDLEEKTNLMLNIIEEDGDTFAKRAEMFYKRKPELKTMLKDFNRSYRLLAEKYDHLRTELIQAAHLRSFSSLDSLKSQTIEKCEKEISGHNTKVSKALSATTELTDHPQVSDDDDDDLSFMNTEPETDLESHEGSSPIRKKIDHDNMGESSFLLCNLEVEKMWEEKVSELISENMKQQAELIRRNNYKSERIERLESRVHNLMDENRILKSHLESHSCDVRKQNQQSHDHHKFSRSKSKGTTFFGRLTGCSGSS